MKSLFESFKNANIMISKARSASAEQLTGLLTLAFFLHTYSQKMIGNKVDIESLAWLAINLLSLGLLVFFCTGKVLGERSEHYIANFWRFLRVLLVNYILAILVLCTGRDGAIYSWFKLALDYDLTRFSISFLCSLGATLLLMFYSRKAMNNHNERSEFLWVSTALLLVTTTLMIITYSY